MKTFASLHAEAEGWCRGRAWLPRAPLALWFAWILARHLLDAEYVSLFGPLNLGIHELGHMAFGIFGEFLGIAGGTILQLAIPLGSFWMFRRQGDFFAISASFAWLGTNLLYVGVYAADAREMALPLVSVGDADEGVEHDWNYLLRTLGLLPLDGALGALFRALGLLSLAASLALGAWILRRMARSRDSG